MNITNLYKMWLRTLPLRLKEMNLKPHLNSAETVN